MTILYVFEVMRWNKIIEKYSVNDQYSNFFSDKSVEVGEMTG